MRSKVRSKGWGRHFPQTKEIGLKVWITLLVSGVLFVYCSIAYFRVSIAEARALNAYNKTLDSLMHILTQPPPGLLKTKLDSLLPQVEIDPVVADWILKLRIS